MLKSSALKSMEVTAEKNKKVNPPEAKMQCVNIPEDDLKISQNMLEKIPGCYFANLCVHYPFFAIYFLKKKYFLSNVIRYPKQQSFV